MGQGRVLNILLVEGSDAEARALAGLLNADGHAVSRAGTLSEARELCEDGRFDVMIAENRLPDGAACELLAKAAPCDGVPGILVHSSDDDLCTATADFRARLTRPVEAGALRRAIVRAVGV